MTTLACENDVNIIYHKWMEMTMSSLIDEDSNVTNWTVLSSQTMYSDDLIEA